MNYEELYEALSSVEKDLKDSVSQIQKYQKAIVKDTDFGNIRNLKKSIAFLGQALENSSHLVNSLSETVEGFDVSEYFKSGEFAAQIVDECRSSGIDVIGEYPVFEMFPYRVRLDEENMETFVDKKKVPCVRPKSLVETIKTGQEKLKKATFNAQGFLNEMAAAYDIAIMKSGKNPGTDVLLDKIYKLMTPMGRFRKDYDQQNFAYDIAKLYESGESTTKDGRRYQFGESRNGKKGIRILNSEGREMFMATVCFIEE